LFFNSLLRPFTVGIDKPPSNPNIEGLSNDIIGLEWPSTMADCCFTGCTVITGVMWLAKKIEAFLPSNML
jgi:hypothetical protein